MLKSTNLACLHKNNGQSRKLGKNNWDIERFLKCIKDETSARESCNYLKNEGCSKTEEIFEDEFEKAFENKYTTQTLYSGNNVTKGKFCVFLSKE